MSNARGFGQTAYRACFPQGSGEPKSYMITEENFIDFKCPYCGDPVSFPHENAGSLQACPGCNESLIVPEDGSEIGGRIPLPITTSRLVLRRLTHGDWKDLLDLMSDEEFFRYQDGVPLDEDSVLRWPDSEAHVNAYAPTSRFSWYPTPGRRQTDRLFQFDLHRPATLLVTSTSASTAASSGRVSPWRRPRPCLVSASRA